MTRRWSDPRLVAFLFKLAAGKECSSPHRTVDSGSLCLKLSSRSVREYPHRHDASLAAPLQESLALIHTRADAHFTRRRITLRASHPSRVQWPVHQLPAQRVPLRDRVQRDSDQPGSGQPVGRRDSQDLLARTQRRGSKPRGTRRPAPCRRVRLLRAARELCGISSRIARCTRTFTAPTSICNIDAIVSYLNSS